MSQDDTTPELVRIFPDQPVTGADGLDFQFDGLARTVLHAAAPWAFGKPSDKQAWSGRYQPIEEKRAFNLSGVCFYYLGLDMERLEALLPGHLAVHKAAFLEKIVQISLDLPEISQAGASGYVRTLVEKTPLRALLLSEAGHAHDDIAVIARVLGSRHPRHVKRFLNDLAMSLAVLRNTECLGKGAKRLPPRCVVAWHLLREALPEEKWREVRALTANLDAFLRQWRAAQEAGEEKERPEGWDEELAQLSRGGSLDAHIAILDGLSAPQRDLLVHTGSPPREVKSAAIEDKVKATAGFDAGVRRGTRSSLFFGRRPRPIANGLMTR